MAAVVITFPTNYIHKIYRSILKLITNNFERIIVRQAIPNKKLLSLFMQVLPFILAMQSSFGGLQAPTTQTTRPIVTGTTVLGIKYSGGVMLAADTLASYGSLARYKDVRRLQKVGDNVLLGASGEISDFQSIMEMVQGMHQDDLNEDDGYKRNPSEYFNYLRAVMYNRRNKGNPYWNQLLVAGYHKEAPFLGYVDMIGTAYEENFIATGFGAYLAIPIIRERW